MKKRIWVIARKGMPCPMETHGVIDDSKPVEVVLTRYIDRMIADGSLLETDAPKQRKREVTRDSK